MKWEREPSASVAKPTIKINCSDFWGHFEPTNNYFWNLLSQSFDLQLSDNPDFLIYSAYGRKFKEFDCIRIFYTGEAIAPDFRECDFAFSFDYNDDARHYRLPLYALYADNELLTRKPSDTEAVLAKKTRFCNFVVSNPSCMVRNEFFRRLSRYKRVDSAGSFMNNIGRNLGPTPQDKWEFLAPYKFTIAFESKSYPGYTTEKIFEPMLVNSIPLYWGNPLVDRDFNPRSFINYHEFANEDEFIERTIETDRNDSLYLQYMAEPWFSGNRVNSFVDPANVTRQFAKIFGQLGEITPVARGPMRIYSAAKGVRIWSESKAASARERFEKTFRSRSNE
jgi:hypothetical protein